MFLLHANVLHSFHDLFIGNILHLAFIIDGQEIDVLCGDVNVGDDACAAGFSFSFGADGKADLVAVVTEVGSSGGIFFVSPR
jgi:hypothetical protein